MYCSHWLIQNRLSVCRHRLRGQCITVDTAVDSCNQRSQVSKPLSQPPRPELRQCLLPHPLPFLFNRKQHIYLVFQKWFPLQHCDGKRLQIRGSSCISIIFIYDKSKPIWQARNVCRLIILEGVQTAFPYSAH